MRKSQFLLILLGLLQLNAMSQGTGSLEQYYIGAGGTYMMAPIGSYQFSKGLYFEGRYNYEDVNSFSFYCGKTIEREGKLSFSITPMAGMVFGFYKGGSVGANISLDYKGISFFSAPQYTFSMADKTSNFGYNWTDLSFSVSKWLSLGVSAQVTQLYQTQLSVEKGFMIEPSFGKWAFPLYIYNPTSSTDRYFVLGLNFEWEMNRRKGRKSSPVVPVSTTPAPAIIRTPAPPVSVEKKEVKRVSVATFTVNGTTSQEHSPLAAAAVRTPGSANRAQISSQEFAVAMGPFKNREEAVNAQLKIKSKFGSVRITTGERQFWITGFSSEKEAVSFTTENTFKEFKAPFKVMSYKVKRVEVITVGE